ncbi:MAG: hypothetical protein ACLUEK_02455 [Oscillospiraceae bacterium]
MTLAEFADVTASRTRRARLTAYSSTSPRAGSTSRSTAATSTSRADCWSSTARSFGP